MAKLVKIKEVYLYVALTEHAQECYEIKKYLTDKNIPHTVLSYNDEAQHVEIFNSLATWTFKDGQRPREDFRFPLAYWTNLYDDYESDMELTIGIDEFETSTLATTTVPIR